ncbi:hypothetical protein [Novosphingobium sp.]|uniref:hypothetical protein n=1 Tax=Novosphingobium sp. TaxID=1874826 RepID=UPI0035AE8985
MGKLLLNVLILFVVLDVILAVSGAKVRYDSFVVQPGTHYLASGFGDLAEQKKPSLVCQYWNGMQLTDAVFEYGTEMTERTECPFLLK